MNQKAQGNCCSKGYKHSRWFTENVIQVAKVVILTSNYIKMTTFVTWKGSIILTRGDIRKLNPAREISSDIRLFL